MIEIPQLDLVHIVESEGDEHIVASAGSTWLGSFENENLDSNYGEDIAIIPFTWVNVTSPSVRSPSSLPERRTLALQPRCSSVEIHRASPALLLIVNVNAMPTSLHIASSDKLACNGVEDIEVVVICGRTMQMCQEMSGNSCGR